MEQPRKHVIKCVSCDDEFIVKETGENLIVKVMVVYAGELFAETLVNAAELRAASLRITSPLYTVAEFTGLTGDDIYMIREDDDEYEIGIRACGEVQYGISVDERQLDALAVFLS